MKYRLLIGAHIGATLTVSDFITELPPPKENFPPPAYLLQVLSSLGEAMDSLAQLQRHSAPSIMAS
ncbi:MAG: hypothetical protein KME25_26805 [Symplocastrum torsivum CPER-KK1]|uniref:Uncharacterized protein n=1 Tax=Symplocastrum torsivum CPER-KK1 TaxID=450513 RepID=A0A951PSE5_9CYAN|nr:hypothetical protein [Symplocastrum torsivum CPER-KK1]